MSAKFPKGGGGAGPFLARSLFKVGKCRPVLSHYFLSFFHIIFWLFSKENGNPTFYVKTVVVFSRPRDYKLFSCASQLSTKFQLLIKLKYRQIKRCLGLSLSDFVYIMVINV